jgi:ABC-type phosphate transport system ATPase subunit
VDAGFWASFLSSLVRTFCCLQTNHRSQMALVSQDASLFATTIYDNIAMGRPNASRDEVMEAAKAALVDSFVSLLPQGYATHVGSRGIALSGGQRQRIAIARAVLKNPRVSRWHDVFHCCHHAVQRLQVLLAKYKVKVHTLKNAVCAGVQTNVWAQCVYVQILLLDEATSALDSASEAAVSLALQNLAGSCIACDSTSSAEAAGVSGAGMHKSSSSGRGSRTVVMVAHRLSTVRHADTIVVMAGGQVMEQGSHNELLANTKGMCVCCIASAGMFAYSCNIWCVMQHRATHSFMSGWHLQLWSSCCCAAETTHAAKCKCCLCQCDHQAHCSELLCNCPAAGMYANLVQLQAKSGSGGGAAPSHNHAPAPDTPLTLQPSLLEEQESFRTAASLQTAASYQTVASFQTANSYQTANIYQTAASDWSSSVQGNSNSNSSNHSHSSKGWFTRLGHLRRRSQGSGCVSAAESPSATHFKDVEGAFHTPRSTEHRRVLTVAAAAGKSVPELKPPKQPPQPSAFWRLMRLVKTEATALAVGALGCLGHGSMMPAFATLLASILAIFHISSNSEMLEQARFYAISLACVGLGSCCAVAVQFYTFGAVGTKLARRLRVLLLGAILRQEIG